MAFGKKDEENQQYYGRSSVRSWIYAVKKETFDKVKQMIDRPPYAPEPKGQ